MASVPNDLIPPLITPLMPDGAVDLASVDRLVRYVVDAGANGVLVLGSTGEGGHLLPAEQEAVVATAATAHGGEVMAGVPCLNTRQAATMASRFAAAGARTLLVPPPSMFPLSQRELGEHFETVAAAAQLPVIAYHVPTRVPTSVSPELFGQLVDQGVLAGLKDSSGDLGGHRAAVLVTSRSPGARLLTGSETCIDAAIAMGFTGAVPGLANVFTPLHRTLLDAAARQDWHTARVTQERLVHLHRLYEGSPGGASFTAVAVGALKAALMQRGVIESSTLTPPLTPVSDTLTRHVAEVLQATADIATGFGCETDKQHSPASTKCEAVR